MNIKELVTEFGHFYPFRLSTLAKVMPYEKAFELNTKVTGWCYGPKKRKRDNDLLTKSDDPLKLETTKSELPTASITEKDESSEQS